MRAKRGVCDSHITTSGHKQELKMRLQSAVHQTDPPESGKQLLLLLIITEVGLAEDGVGQVI